MKPGPEGLSSPGLGAGSLCHAKNRRAPRRPSRREHSDRPQSHPQTPRFVGCGSPRKDQHLTQRADVQKPVALTWQQHTGAIAACNTAPETHRLFAFLFLLLCGKKQPGASTGHSEAEIPTQFDLEKLSLLGSASHLLYHLCMGPSQP